MRFPVRARTPAPARRPPRRAWVPSKTAADVTPPNTTIGSGPADPTVDTYATFTFSADEIGCTFEYRLDGGAWISATSPLILAGPIALGGHTLEVRATDAALNVDPTPASWTWTIEAVPAAPVVRQALPPIEVYAEVKKPDGRTYRWDGEGSADSVPTNVKFTTKRMEGFSQMSLVLARRLDDDEGYVDVALHDEITLLDALGDVVWEGRVAALPHEVSEDSHSIQVEAVGWMSHARDVSFRDVIVDHDLSRWRGPSAERQAAQIAAGRTPGGPSVEWDQTVKQSALLIRTEGAWAANALPTVGGYYVAGPGVEIDSVYFAWKKGANIDAGLVSWSWQMFIGDNDLFIAYDGSPELRAAGPGSGTLVASADASRGCALLQLSWVGGASVAAGVAYDIYATCLAVYGRTGLTKRGTADLTIGQGFYASDVLRYLFGKYCPKLNTDGILDTSYPIRQLAWHNLTDTYNAALQVNAPHLLELAAWEDKTVHYYPVDLNDYDWQIRTDDPGVTINLHGDTIDDLRNGVVIEYEDVNTGNSNVLYPSDHPELRDDSEDNPANQHGTPVWGDPITLSIPLTEADALQIGSALLTEANQPKAPGSISITGGYIRDRAGNWQPTTKVRATETVAIVNHTNNRPRIITETGWDERKLTIAVDQEVKRVDAFIDRVATATKARNLQAS